MIRLWKALIPKQWHRAIALFVASLLLTVGVASCSSSNSSITSMAVINTSVVAPPNGEPGKTLDKIMAAGKIRVAVPNDFTPFGSVAPDMTPQGYDIDVAGEIAKGIGVKLELVPVVGNYRIPFLQTDRVDIVISSLGKNKARAKIIDFSKPYAPFFSGVYGGPNLKVSSLDDLKGHTLGVAQGSLEDLEISKLPPEKVPVVKRFSSNSLTASALLSGQVELIATGNVVAAKVIKDNPNSKIDNKFIMKNSPCYVGVRKGDAALVAKLDSIIDDIKQSGKLNALSLKWFGEPLPDLTPPPAS
ncbi:MAG: transporter substrate-binding domain-containing protein [Stenomitos rutilans HA7619-LM2]|jgi:polar amino acid transport system substrate-binding protein|nr:transporter substrate-binding domain-containing protein [Stenomitos rutilans HA7619-LM2]